MSLDEAKKIAMRESTRDAAIALLEDLDFVWGCLRKQSPTSGDVRQMAGTLRRMLLEDHLTHVAAPRVGKLRFPIFDGVELIHRKDAEFVSAGFAPIFGWENGLVEGYWKNKTGESFLALATDKRTFRTVTTKSLLSDPVARSGDQVITRSDVIKFVCYHDFGVHYSGGNRPQFNTIQEFRRLLTFARDEKGEVAIHNNPADVARPKGMLMDLAHVHTFSTAYYMAMAPDVKALASTIKSELGGP